MIDKFGQVMVYVKDPRAVADFWVNKIGFKEVEVGEHEGKIISVEITPNDSSDTNIVLFDKVFVEQTSPGLNLGTPSILFSSYNLKEMRESLVENGVDVSEIGEMGGMVHFNFPDIEGNYFAVRQIDK